MRKWNKKSKGNQKDKNQNQVNRRLMIISRMKPRKWNKRAKKNQKTTSKKTNNKMQNLKHHHRKINRLKKEKPQAKKNRANRK